MANDPYSMCPCGSGKKLKFCCGEILPDLQRAFRIRDNQPEAAAKIFSDLLKKNPDKDVVARELTSTLYEMGQTAEARKVAADFLKSHPDHPGILLSLAEISLKEDGFEASRRILHRTFQLCSKTQPLGIAYLAAMIASGMAKAGCLLSAREHLALAVRMSTGERQKQLVLQLVSFESESSLPFHFRSAYQLLPITCSEEATQQDMRARKLSVLGCWEPAAILYNRLADSYPTEGAIWYNMGLCQAWDGRIAEAAASLHHAATLLHDYDQAIEAEALAQQIDITLSTERYSTVAVRLNVRSMSEFLTRLESDPVFKRNDTHDHEHCHHPNGTGHAAMMVLLSSVVTAEEVTDASKLPESIADLDLYDILDADEAAAASITDPFLVVTATENQIDNAIVKLRGIAGDLILTSADEEKKSVTDYERAEARPFDRRYYCPTGLTQKRFKSLIRSVEPQAIEAWLNLPLATLGGKSALEASKEESLKTKLGASLLVMLSVAANYDQAPDLKALRQRLNLPSRQTKEIPANAAMAAIPAMQYERLDVTKLADNQLSEFTNRCSVLGLRNQVRNGLDEILRRPAALKEFGARRAWLMRAAIARVEESDEFTFTCLENARQAVEPGGDAFRTHLELDIRELAFRLEDPADSQLKPLLHKFRDRYLHKIPEIESVIIEQLENAGCPELAAELEGGLYAVGSSSGGLWTPGAENAPAAGGGQLWLPGQ
jgi:hypothetical protein